MSFVLWGGGGVEEALMFAGPEQPEVGRGDLVSRGQDDAERPRLGA